MRDLYKRIGLNSRIVPVEEIERAITVAALQDPDLASEARSILLNEHRRAHYDRVYTILKSIGEIRANIAVGHGPNWTMSDCSDFNSRVTLSSQIKKSQPAGTAKVDSSMSGMDKAILVSALLIGAIVLVVAFSENDSQSPVGSQSSVATSTQHARPVARQETPVDAELAQREETARREEAARNQEIARRNQLRRMVVERSQRAGIVAEPDIIKAIVEMLVAGESAPLPLTGIMSKSFSGAGVAPLEVKTSEGSNYFVKVVDWATKSEILTAFIRGGEKFETYLPVGSYEIRYASGSDWYGSVIDFGENASYAKCDDRFDFVRTARGYNGYTIELIKQVGGNLDTLPISPNDF